MTRAIVVLASTLVAQAELLEQRRVTLAGTQVSGRFEATFDAPGDDRWVRLVEPVPKEVLVNGVQVTPTERDRVTRSIALSPYLRPRAANRLVIVGGDAAPAIEITPRVFAALVTRLSQTARFTIANTLENASNVEIRWGTAARSGYVPPESLIDVEIFGEDGASAVLTKFPESLEAGYDVRVAVPGKPAKGAP